MKSFFHFSFVLLLIASISGGLLSYVNNKTTPIISKREIAQEIEARKEVYKEADLFDEAKKIEVDAYSFIPVYSKGKQLGYVVNGTGQGYGGEIKLTLAFNIEGKIVGLKILSAKETPGLGDKIFNEDWLNKWKDRDKDYQFKVGLDSFGGATISPKGVYTEIIKILNVYEEKVKK